MIKLQKISVKHYIKKGEKLTTRKYIVAVDFDGTIAPLYEDNIDNFDPSIPPIQGVVDVLKEFHERGIVIILWTCRSGDYLTEAVEYCKKFGIPIDYVNQNPEWLPFTTSNKIFAHKYIDDNLLAPMGLNWSWIREEVTQGHEEFLQELGRLEIQYEVVSGGA